MPAQNRIQITTRKRNYSQNYFRLLDKFLCVSDLWKKIISKFSWHCLFNNCDKEKLSSLYFLVEFLQL